jgi:hypothetical protein
MFSCLQSPRDVDEVFTSSPSLARRSCLLRRSSCEGWINEGGLLHPSVAERASPTRRETDIARSSLLYLATD